MVDAANQGISTHLLQYLYFPLHHPFATARLPHRSQARLRRGSAAQSGEVRDGGITPMLTGRRDYENLGRIEQLEEHAAAAVVVERVM